MLRLAHIINTTEITESKKASYLHIAQPLTMRTMMVAKEEARESVHVDLVAVKHKDEILDISDSFNWAPEIESYAWEYIETLKNLDLHKPLPRIKDILSSLYECSDADYFIYTNLDIGLYPKFYLRVKELIEEGYDAFCINRKDLPKKLKGIVLDEDHLNIIYSTEGMGISHPGIDCFIFRREIVPFLNLGNVYVGFPPIGQVLKTQVEINSERFTWIKDKSWTFHIGIDSPWQKRGIYFEENYRQASGLYSKSISLPTALWYRLNCRLLALLYRGN